MVISTFACTLYIAYIYTSLFIHVHCMTGLLLCEEREQSVIQQSVTSLQRDMIKLNSLITQKKGEHLKLEHGSAIAENLFISSLKVKM